MKKGIAKITCWVGLDVHAATIVVAVAETDGSVRSVGTVPNTPEAIRKVLRKLGSAEQLHVCYEAGPCGYALYRQLLTLGVRCEVIAPTLIPRKAGERIKTDRRDAEKLARYLRSGDLTVVWVPSEEQEALRDLVRAREAAKKDQLRARHRVGKLLLRRGIRRPAETGVKAWGEPHRRWLRTVRFEATALQLAYEDAVEQMQQQDERVARLDRAIAKEVDKLTGPMRASIDALQSLKGIGLVTATTLVSEVGDFRRFEHPKPLMAFCGLVPREASSGEKTRRGAITKTGTARVRRVLVEAAWHYRHQGSSSQAVRRRREGQPAEVVRIAERAQRRLRTKYQTLHERGKPLPQVVTAVAREMLGFIWDISTRVTCPPEQGTRRN